jgi:hypothetical protein
MPPMSLADPPKLEYADEACLFASWRAIGFPLVGSRTLTPESAKAQARAFETWCKPFGLARVAEVTLVAVDAALPAAETRAVYDGVVPIIHPYFACSAAVFEGTGLRGVLVRGLLMSFSVLSGNKHPRKICANVGECAAFIAKHASSMGLTATASEIAEAIAAVRSMAVERGIFSPAAAAVIGR